MEGYKEIRGYLEEVYRHLEKLRERGIVKKKEIKEEHRPLLVFVLVFAFSFIFIFLFLLLILRR